VVEDLADGQASVTKATMVMRSRPRPSLEGGSEVSPSATGHHRYPNTIGKTMTTKAAHAA
jgi:hypothetical protein